MIIIEDKGKKELRYSDQNVMLLQEDTGKTYIDALDKKPCKHTYSETETPVPEEFRRA